MSTNLLFEVKGTNAVVDFPYQTSTKLTYAVLNATTIEERMNLIRADLQPHMTSSELHDKLEKIRELLSTDRLLLTYI